MEEAPGLIHSYGGSLSAVELVPSDFEPDEPESVYQERNSNIGEPVSVDASFITSDVTGVRVDSLTLSLASDSDVTSFSWLDSVEVSVTQGASEIVIGSVSIISNGAVTVTVSMAAEGNDLAAMIKNGPFQFRLKMAGVVPTSNVRVNGSWVIGVYQE